MDRYEELPQDEVSSKDGWSQVEEAESSSRYLRFPSIEEKRCHYLFWLLVVCILSVLVAICTVTMSSICSMRHSAASNSEHGTILRQVMGVSTSHCGSSTFEALGAGCVFDLFAFGWFPPDCMDMELYNESLSALEKRVNGDTAFSIRHNSPVIDLLPEGLISIESGHHRRHNDTPADDLRLYAKGSWDHHLVACTYAWQRVQRAAMRRWPLDEWSSSLALAQECGPDLLLNWKHEESRFVWYPLRVWFPECGLSREDLQRNVAALRNSSKM